MLGNLFKPKPLRPTNPCTLCGRQLDEQYSPLVITDDEGEHDVGKICKSCADKLEELDLRLDDDGDDLG